MSDLDISKLTLVSLGHHPRFNEPSARVDVRAGGGASSHTPHKMRANGVGCTQLKKMCMTITQIVPRGNHNTCFFKVDTSVLAVGKKSRDIKTVKVYY